jgi:hypothetical protein
VVNDELLEQFDLSPCVCCPLRLKRLLSLCGPQPERLFALIVLELIGHPKQGAENGGAVVAGQVDESGFHDEAAEFNEMPRTLATLDSPRAHVKSRPCGLVPVARHSVAPERRRQRRGQVVEQIAATGDLI